MLLGRVAARLLAGSETIVDVPPMMRRDLGRIDADRLDGVDDLQDALDLRPALHLQQNVAAGTHEGQRLIGFARRDRAHDVDARDDRAEVVGRPTDKGEDAMGREADDAPAPVENLFLDVLAEPNPVFDLLLNPGQFDAGQTVDRGAPPARGASEERRSWRVSFGWGKFAGEQFAQHVGDSHAALERGDLDLAAHVRRDVDGEPRGEMRRRRRSRAGRGSGALTQLSGSAGRAVKARFVGSPGHGAILPTSVQSAVISRAAGLCSLISETRRPDRAASAKATRWPMVVVSTGGS